MKAQKRIARIALGAGVALALLCSGGAAFAEKIVLNALSDRGNIGTFTVDTATDTVAYELNASVVGKKNIVRIHGWAPEGWESQALLEINPGRSLTGVWHYRAEDEPNVLAGLAYVTVGAPGRNRSDLRAQLEQEEAPITQFPSVASDMDMAGTCHLNDVTIVGVVERSEAQMDPAQVRMHRSAPGDRDEDGLRDMLLAVEVRVGGGYIPGLGRIEVELLDEMNPGLIEALSQDADFPARLTMRIKKRYITPAGTFVGDPETYSGIINSIPPYGEELLPQDDVLKLYDEKTGEVAGYFRPGTVVPLFYVDQSEFPGPLAGSVPKPAPGEKARIDKGRARRGAAPKRK